MTMSNNNSGGKGSRPEEQAEFELFEAILAYTEQVKAGTTPNPTEFVKGYRPELREKLLKSVAKLPQTAAEAEAAEQAAWNKLSPQLFPKAKE
jgi:hypothetical protein